MSRNFKLLLKSLLISGGIVLSVLLHNISMSGTPIKFYEMVYGKKFTTTETIVMSMFWPYLVHVEMGVVLDLNSLEFQLELQKQLEQELKNMKLPLQENSI